MEIKEEINKNRIGSRFWINSENKSFQELVHGNEMLYKEWGQSFTVSQNKKYSNRIFKPINGYAMNFWPKPEFRLENDNLILTYHTHAEIWFEQKEGGLYALDKTWQRQFYPSHLKINSSSECFNSVYKFYIPWIIDKNIVCEVKEIKKSPIKLINSSINFSNLNPEQDVWNCDWFHFFIKSSGDHIKNYNGKVYGILEVGTPICDIIIKDKDTIEELMKEHESKN
jgi:hypothetical protein